MVVCGVLSMECEECGVWGVKHEVWSAKCRELSVE